MVRLNGDAILKGKTTVWEGLSTYEPTFYLIFYSFSRVFLMWFNLFSPRPIFSQFRHSFELFFRLGRISRGRIREMQEAISKNAHRMMYSVRMMALTIFLIFRRFQHAHRVLCIIFAT
jgi:hypothetical protein